MANPKAAKKPVLPLKTRIVVAFISNLSDAVRRKNGTINRRLLNLIDFKSSPSPSKPIRSVISSDTVVDSKRKLWFRVYTPTGGSTLPVMIFFHGGGFCFLSAASAAYNLVCLRFARRIPAVVVSVEYRRTPEHRFPCQYDDGFDILRYLDDHHAQILPPNADLSRCFLAGDSAGANLAHHLAVRAGRSQFSAVKVIGLISIQPFFGGEERTESEIRLMSDSVLLSVARCDWCWQVFVPEGSNRDHYAVNVSGPNAEDISGVNYPRTLVFVGGFDPLQDWQRRYYNWLKESGKDATLIEYPAMIHAFYIFPELPESSQLISQVKDFVANVGGFYSLKSSKY